MRQNQNQSARSSGYHQPAIGQSPLTPTPPIQYPPSQPPRRSDSPGNQLQVEAAQHQHHNPYSQYAANNDYDLPVDPALMEGLQPNLSLAELPPSPFLAAGQGHSRVPQVAQLGHLDVSNSNMHDQSRMSIEPSGADERAPTAREELRRRLNRVAQYGQK